ncbi:MAG: superoxide dismutase [Beijerinckiaceae bacterium]|nr:superoxide dismutase [Beijerinckiaceae bacterium]
MLDRRRFFALTAAGAAVATLPRMAFAQDKPFSLPPLGYPYEALEPHIDAQTMNLHHTRHHQAFITNLNNLVEKWPELAKGTPDDVLRNLSKAPEAIRTSIQNNLGGHWNHTFFWDIMTPGGAKEPQGELKDAIDKSFGSVDKMKERVNQAGAGRFGSGWAWLVVGKDGKLDVISTPNQDPPHLQGVRSTILGVDVWEHAYYLKYHNRRPDYLAAWWNTVNWDKASANFAKKG